MGINKIHYKMYKDGKKWIFAGLTVITVGTSLFTVDALVHADENTSMDKTIDDDNLTLKATDELGEDNDNKKEASISNTNDMNASIVNDNNEDTVNVVSENNTTKFNGQFMESPKQEYITASDKSNIPNSTNVSNSESSLNSENSTGVKSDHKDGNFTENAHVEPNNKVNEGQISTNSVIDKNNEKNFEREKVAQLPKNQSKKTIATKQLPQVSRAQDLKFPDSIWIDTNPKHYSFTYFISSDKKEQIVYSTDHLGTGIVFVYLINNQTKEIIDQKVLQKNSSVSLKNGIRIYNDDYSVTLSSPSVYRKWTNSENNTGNLFTNFVPQLITQTVSFVDENGNNIIDAAGNEVKPIQQVGLTGQKYTTNAPDIINGYYVVNPKNSSGIMSQFGFIGKQHISNFHNGYRIVYTEVDGLGTMDVKIYDYNNNVVYSNPYLKKNETVRNIVINGYLIFTVDNPYVDQTNDVVYVYHKLGALVPDVPGVKPVPYPNDPQDPTKPGNPIIPDIPGYTPVDSVGNPVKPGDTYPVDPTRPGDNTILHYEANDQQATVSYVDATTGKTIKVDNLTGVSDSRSDYRTQNHIQDLLNQGYELVSDTYPANGVVFDHDDVASQDYVVTLKHKITTITPTEPGKPGEPINPNKPQGPKWPAGTDYASLYHEVNQTIHYVDENGRTVATSVTDKVSFDRTGVVDEVTGEVTYTEWQALNNDDVFDTKPTPIKAGYEADQAEIPAQTVRVDSDDQIITVTYHKLESSVPNVPVHPDNSHNQAKPVNPIVSEVPDYTPVESAGKLDKTGNNYLVTPMNLGNNTNLHYDANDYFVKNKSDKINTSDTNDKLKLPKTSVTNEKDDYTLNVVLLAVFGLLLNVLGIAKKINSERNSKN